MKNYINIAIAGIYPYASERPEDAVIDWEVPSIVKNYRKENPAHKKKGSKQGVAHNRKSRLQKSDSELLWIINNYE